MVGCRGGESFPSSECSSNGVTGMRASSSYSFPEIKLAAAGGGDCGDSCDDDNDDNDDDGNAGSTS